MLGSTSHTITSQGDFISFYPLFWFVLGVTIVMGGLFRYESCLEDMPSADQVSLELPSPLLPDLHSTVLIFNEAPLTHWPE
jgi:hypothetical protein